MGKFKALALAALLVVAPAGTAAADELVKEWTGQGKQTTRPFTVDGPWEVQWTYRGSRVFQIYVYTLGSYFSDIVANQLDAASGSAFRPKPGTYYLKIDGRGLWTVRVVRIE